MLAISEYLTVVRLSVINAAVMHRKKKRNTVPGKLGSLETCLVGQSTAT
jgi:hypothetical protein